MSHTGRCLCGAVTFSAESVDHHVHACHCSMCRSWSGGPLLSAQAGGVTFTGDELRRYASSEWAERGFCGKCGSSLFYHMPEPDIYVISTGAFDKQDEFTLAGEIYIEEKPPAYDFAGDHPRQTGEEFLASIGMGPS